MFEIAASAWHVGLCDFRNLDCASFEIAASDISGSQQSKALRDCTISEIAKRQFLAPSNAVS